LLLLGLLLALLFLSGLLCLVVLAVLEAGYVELESADPPRPLLADDE
jgi:hypothetical protein